jgi:ABC-type nitrate/sulfonate/bicarbonate transport system permease component
MTERSDIADAAHERDLMPPEDPAEHLDGGQAEWREQVDMGWVEGPGWWRRQFSKTWVLRILFYGGIVVAWQVTAMIKGEFFLPTIPQTVKGFGELLTEGYASTIFGSLRQLVVGFVIALVIAIPIGALMGRSKFASDILSPYVYTLFVTPKQTLLPVLIIAFGIGFWYRAWTVVLFAVFFPIINTAAGVHYVDKELREAARAFGTSRWRMLTRVYLPAAAPFIVAGIRLGFGMAMKAMVIAELWILAGTGALLETFSRSPMRLDLYYPLVLLIIGFAVLVNVVLLWAEKKLRPAAQIAGQTAGQV